MLSGTTSRLPSRKTDRVRKRNPFGTAVAFQTSSTSTPPGPEQLRHPLVYYKLDAFLRRDRGQAQLGEVVRPEILYQDDYPYESSATRDDRMHFRAMASDIVDRLGFGNLAFDVRSNVGALLQGFKNRLLRVLGIEPAPNIARLAVENGIPTVNDFFTTASALTSRSEFGPASVITATSVFAHVFDLDELMRAVDLLLKPDGVFVVEAPWFLHLVDRLEYDTIYHEHYSYLSVTPLRGFFDRIGCR